ncbi:MAG: MFS transporter [Beijerinckiaceae bacterium]
MTTDTTSKEFFGWKAVWGAFLLAVFGWGLGFYGPPIYLQTVSETRGWSIGIVSAAVTFHFLVGALVVANLPALYRRYGLPLVTKCGAVILALGLIGWSLAAQPWQLFIATLFSGAGWVAMGAAAVNAIVSPWFVTGRPKALSTAYNGASIGGVVFAPLWVLAISTVGFTTAAALISIVLIATIWWLSDRFFVHTPASLGQLADNGLASTLSQTATKSIAPLPGAALWQNWQFRTLAAGMALGLFAQIGLLAHLFSLIVPVVGAAVAGAMMALATASAIAGRTLFGWLMPPTADRRVVACLSFTIQIIGSLLLWWAGDGIVMICLGIVLFGFGIGNATSLPPLIAQVEFAKEDTARVVPLIVAMGQATYAFAPLTFGVLRELQSIGVSSGTMVYCGAAFIQLITILCFLAGRRRMA